MYTDAQQKAVLRWPLIGGLAMGILVVAPAIAAELCTCLAAQEHGRSGKWDGLMDVSLLVPAHATGRRSDDFDTTAIRWTVDTRALALSFGMPSSERVHFTDLTVNECSVVVNQHRVLVIRGQEKMDQTANAVWGDLPPARSSVTLSGSANSEAALCSLMANAMWSVSLGGDWTHLKIVAVSQDAKSFTFRYGSGGIRTARVDDVVTQDYGKVVSISHREVHIMDILPDGRGGWREEERIVPAGGMLPDR